MSTDKASADDVMMSPCPNPRSLILARHAARELQAAAKWLIESAGDAQPELDNARLIGSGAYRRLVAASATYDDIGRNKS